MNIGKGVKFERIRRVTGYLSGDLSQWNDAKKAEERDRVKHGGVKPKKSNGSLCKPLTSKKEAAFADCLLFFKL